MADDERPDLTNAFVTEILEANRNYWLRNPADKNADDLPLRTVRFDGYLGPTVGGRCKIYSSPFLSDGYEFPTSAILIHKTLPAGEREPLERDVVWVDADADILYFTPRRRPGRDPQGGSTPPPPGDTRPPGP